MKLAALADAEPRVFWLDDKSAPEPAPALLGPAEADLAVVGGGYTGLWTALRAKERYPSLDVVLLEVGHLWIRGQRPQRRLLRRQPHPRVRQRPGPLAGLRWMTSSSLGLENLDAIGATITRLGIDCDWQRTGELTVATAPHHLDELAAEAEERSGVRLLDQDAARAEVNSPTYLGALHDPGRTALVEPARLAWGLRQACLDLGVRIHENSQVTRLHARSLATATGSVRAERIALATNAFPSLLRRLRLYTVPVYDLVLVTEPLSAAQLSSIGWRHRQGVGDASNLFHYYRLTRDNRILWGGYLPLYHFAQPHRPGLRATRLHPQAPGPALLHHVPPAGRPALHPPLGRRHRHQHPLLRLLRHRPRRPASATPSATPASASPPPASAPTSCSTSCTAKTPNAPASAWSANAPSASHPSPSAPPASTSPAGPCPEPTPTPATATSGSEPSTEWA